MRERRASEIRENVVTATNEIIKNLNGFKDTILEICSQPEEKRVLKLGNIKIDGDSISFQITDQSHRGVFFGHDGSDEFIASNGMRITSQYYPDFYSDTLFCRGIINSNDNHIVSVSTYDFCRILEAVAEYNKEGAK